jgi:hypothetical protein
MHKNFKDLTGMKFGHWVVVRKDQCVNSAWKWLCKCSCGAEVLVFGSSLKSGGSTQCSSCSKKGRVVVRASKALVREVSKNIKSLPFSDLSKIVHEKINVLMNSFTTYNNKIKSLYDEIEALEKNMYVIVAELEPVHYLIYSQDPALKSKFESLKILYGESND